MMPCPICRSSASAWKGFRYDDRYGYPGRFELGQCSICRHTFLDVQFSADELVKLYSSNYPRRSLDVEKHRPHKEDIEAFSAWLNGSRCSAFRWVPKGVRVLDIGCGFCESLGYHEGRGCEAHGVEADENALRVAQRYGYKVYHGVFNPLHYLPEYFDYVTLDQAIEHMVDPVQTLRGIAQVLKVGGVAILSTPNCHGWGAKLFGGRWINWHAPYHLQFFSVKSMTEAAGQAGLVLDETITVTNSEWLAYQWHHLLFPSGPGEKSRFWNAAWRGTLGERILLHALALAHQARIDHILTRVFDALGAGDNRVFILRKP